MNQTDSQNQDTPGTSYGWGNVVAAGFGVVLLFLMEDWLILPGSALLLLSIFWPWKIGRFPVGRVLALTLAILFAVFQQYELPEPIETRNPRGASNSLGAVDFNIYGVKPGMNSDQVEALLGDSQGYAFDGGHCVVKYYDSGEVSAVEGDQLFDAEKVFLKKGQSKQKLRAILGKPQYRSGGYTVVDPDLEVKFSEDKIESFTLTK